MLQTLGSTESLTRPTKGGVGVGDKSKARYDGSELDRSKVNNSEVDSNEVRDDEIEKKVLKSAKSKKMVWLDFLTSGAKLAFTELRQAFVKALILYYFDLEHYIRIETDVLGYAIGGVFSQLTLNNSGQWHLVAFLSHKMIPAETRYETYNGELSGIIEAFKT